MSEESGNITADLDQNSWAPKHWSRAALAQDPLRTERLTLRPLRAEDADDVWQYQRDSEILRYIPWPERTREEAREHTERRASAGEVLAHDGDHVFLAVELADGPETGRVIGDLMLRISSAAKAEVEIGWVFASDQQGQGYATEAASEAVRLAFEQFEAHRVVAHLDARNTASASLCTRLGMRHEGTSFEQEWEPGGWVDLELFGVDHEGWLAFGSGSPAPHAASPTPVPPTVRSDGPPTPFLLPFDVVEQGVVPLRTERLELRAYRENDGDGLWGLMCDPEVTQFLTLAPRTREEAAETARENSRGVQLTHEGDAVRVVVSVDAVFAGQAKLEVTSVEEQVLEIGWTLARAFQGRGLAREAAAALLGVAFEQIGAHRVIAYLNPENQRSAALATRLGMRPEQLRRQYWPEAHGLWSDAAVYAITAEEWRGR